MSIHTAVPLVQLILAIVTLALTGMIFVLGYRFTVRASIRAAIGEIPPLSLEEYSVTPVVNSVKWRPCRGQTTLKFLFYEHDDGQHPANAEKFGPMRALEKMSGAELQRGLESRLGRDYGVSSVKEANLYRSGINIPCGKINQINYRTWQPALSR